METRKPTTLSDKTAAFLADFMAAYSGKALKKDSDKTIGSAFIYEKIRVALEYQEEHLIFKNAISRILRRKYALSPNISAEHLVADLMSELAWANYLDPESLNDEAKTKIKYIIDRYFVLLRSARSGRFKKHELQKLIIDLMSCELEETIKPARENEILIDFIYDILKDNLDLEGSRVSDSESEVQLKLAIYSQTLKPDLPLIQSWLLRKIYPDWDRLDHEEIKKIGRSFDPYYNKIDRALHYPLRKVYTAFIKRYIPPFVVMRSLLVNKGVNIEKVSEKPAIFYDSLINEYQDLVSKGRAKVWGATLRAFIFILLTKLSLAFILEVPFDRYLSGRVDIKSLIINVTLPPLLMFVSGTFVKTPPLRNAQLVAVALSSIISDAKIEDRPVPLIKNRKPTSSGFFNFVYLLFTLAVLIGVVWILLWLKFNILSILLFFFFISAVSFFSFRIRNIALELAMKRSRDDALTSLVELVFLPFIRIGRSISDSFSSFNPAILFLDFVIEAPLKTIIKILNSWFKFINAKKEELEL